MSIKTTVTALNLAGDAKVYASIKSLRVNLGNPTLESIFVVILYKKTENFEKVH